MGRRSSSGSCSGGFAAGAVGLCWWWPRLTCCATGCFPSVAIVWALALYGIERVSAAEVRRRINPWRVVGATAARGWQSLSNWSEATQCRGLVPLLAVVSGTARQVAAAVSWSLSALAPPSLRTQSIAHQAVSGTLHALMGITP